MSDEPGWDDFDEMEAMMEEEPPQSPAFDQQMVDEFEAGNEKDSAKNAAKGGEAEEGGKEEEEEGEEKNGGGEKGEASNVSSDEISPSSGGKVASHSRARAGAPAVATPVPLSKWDLSKYLVADYREDEYRKPRLGKDADADSSKVRKGSGKEVVEKKRSERGGGEYQGAQTLLNRSCGGVGGVGLWKDCLKGTVRGVKDPLQSLGESGSGYQAKLMNGTVLYLKSRTREEGGGSALPTGAAEGGKSTILSESMEVLEKKSESIQRGKMGLQEEVAPGSVAGDMIPGSASSQPERAPSLGGVLWVDKYKPKSFSCLITDEKLNRDLLRSLREWDMAVFNRTPPPPPQNFRGFSGGDQVRFTSPSDNRPSPSSRVTILSGPPGSCKSSLARICMSLAGYSCVTLNLGERTGERLKSDFEAVMECQSLNFGKAGGHVDSKPKAVIIEGVDTMSSASSGGSTFMKDLLKFVTAEKGKGKKYQTRPVIICVRHRFVKPIKPFLKHARVLEVSSPSYGKVLTRLKKICSLESVVVPVQGLSKLVDMSVGDITSCLHSLQLAANKSRLSQAQVEDYKPSKTVNISSSLEDCIGTSMKDRRSDGKSLLESVFLRPKKKYSKGKSKALSKGSKSISNVFLNLESFNDTSKALDLLFVNLANAKFLDPSLRLTSQTRDELSTAAAYTGDSRMLDVSAASIRLVASSDRMQLLCSNKELWDLKFQRDKKLGLCSDFLTGVKLSTKLSLQDCVLSLMPFAVRALSNGQGAGSLSRNVSSTSMLTEDEASAFQRKVQVMKCLGVKFGRVDHGQDPYAHSDESDVISLVPR